MASDDDEPDRETKEFNFRQLCKLRTGDPLKNIRSNVRHVAVSNKYGMVFVVSNSDIRAVLITTIEKISTNGTSVNEEVTNYPSNVIPLGVEVTHIALNADENYMAVVYRGNGGTSLDFGYVDVRMLNEQNKQGALFASTQLTNSKDIFVRDVCCHPETGNFTAVNLSNGHVLMLELNDKDVINVVASLAQGSPVHSVCWSPKGKQIVVGREDGRIIQYDKSLKIEKKNTTAPSELFKGEVKKVGGLFWISSYFYLAVYNTEDATQPPFVVIVETKKDGSSPSFTALYDIYYGFSEDRLLCYYFAYLSSWDIMVTMGSNGVDAAPLGKVDGKWQRWALQDTGRAEAPLNSDNEDTYPVGNGICFNSTLTIQEDDKELPAAPVYVMLTSDGVLCSYQMVNQFPNTNHRILQQPFSLPYGEVKRRSSMHITAGNIVHPTTLKESVVDEMKAPSLAGPKLIPKAPPPYPGNEANMFEQKPSLSVVAKSSPTLSTGPIENKPMFANPPTKLVTTKSMFLNFSTATANVSVKPSFNFNSASLTTTISSPIQSSTTKVPEPGKSPMFASSISQMPLKQSSSCMPPSAFMTTLSTTRSNVGFSFTSSARPDITDEQRNLPVSSSISQSKAEMSAFQMIPAQPSFGVTNTPISTSNKGTHQVIKANIAQIQSTVPSIENTPLSLQTFQNEEQEIENHTARLNCALEEHILEEMTSFNAELAAFKETFTKLSRRTDLIGTRDELTDLTGGIEEVSRIVDNYKTVMIENRIECDELKDKVLSNFKHFDEAILCKEKMEDHRYSSVLKTRPLDPISTRQRKELRSKTNHLENLLSDINVSLDAKWEEKESRKTRGYSRGSAATAASQGQQIYKTVEAIEQITSNLSNRLHSLSMQSEEIQLINMNLSRTPKTPLKSFHELSSVRQSTIQSSPRKFQQLKQFLTLRGSTPMRKTKRYGFKNVSFGEGSTSPTPQHGKLNPKASSTPAYNASFNASTKSRSTKQKMAPVIEEKSMLTFAVEKLKASSTPIFIKSPVNAAPPKVPENTPVTPLSNKLKDSSQVSMAPNPSVNKNLFGVVSTVTDGNHSQALSQPFSNPGFNFANRTTQSNSYNFSHQEMKKLPEMPHPFNHVATGPTFLTSSGIENITEHPSSLTDSPFTSVSAPFAVQSIQRQPNLSFGSQKASNSSSSSVLSISEPLPSTRETDSTVNSTTFAFSIAGLNSSNIEVLPREPGDNTDNVGSLAVSTDFRNSFGKSPTTEFTVKSEFTSSIASTISSVTSTISKSKDSTASIHHTETDTGASERLFDNDATSITSGGMFSNTAISTTSGGLFGKTATSTTSGGLFGSTATSTASGGLFGKTATLTTSGVLFGSTATSTASGGLFGKTATLTTSGGLFGSTATSTASGGLFGNTATSTTSGGLFGNTATSTTSGGLFGSTATSTASGGLFGKTATLTTSGGLFGSTATSTASGGLFGNTATSTTSGGLFGNTATSTTSGGLFGSTAIPAASGELFGKTATLTTSGGLFGSTATLTASGGLFGNTATSTTSGGLFGNTATSTTSGGLFGNTSTSTTSGGLFGSTATPAASGGLFGNNATSTPSGGLFGSTATSTTSGGLFGNTVTSTAPGVLFGNTATSTTSGGLFGSTATSTASGGMFGNTVTSTTSGGLFDNTVASTASDGLFGNTATSTTSGSLFGGTAVSAMSGGLFGNNSTSTTSGGLFGSKSSENSSTVFSGNGSTTSSGGGMFGSGGGFGLGGKPINDPTKNPFGVAPSANSPQASNNLFGGSSTSVFGQNGNSASIEAGSFSKGFGSGISDSTSGFGSSGFGTSTQSTAPAFGGAPSFGSPPAFGAAPLFSTFGDTASTGGSSFGGAPTFGSGLAFGAGGVGGGISGGAGVPTFGSLANQSNAPSFGQLSGNTGATGNNPSGASFSNWR